MNKQQRDIDLDHAFYALLIDLSPQLSKDRALTRAFAEQLSDFASSWATDSPDIDEREQHLIHWIQSTVPQVESTPHFKLFDESAESPAAWLEEQHRRLRKAVAQKQAAAQTQAAEQKEGRIARLRRRLGLTALETRLATEVENESRGEAQVAGEE